MQPTFTLDSLMKTTATEGLELVPLAPKGKKLWGTATLGDRGQIVIPKAARDYPWNQRWRPYDRSK